MPEPLIALDLMARPSAGPLLALLLAGAVIGVYWRAVLRTVFGTVVALVLVGFFMVVMS